MWFFSAPTRHCVHGSLGCIMHYIETMHNTIVPESFKHNGKAPAVKAKQWLLLSQTNNRFHYGVKTEGCGLPALYQTHTLAALGTHAPTYKDKRSKTKCSRNCTTSKWKVFYTANSGAPAPRPAKKAPPLDASNWNTRGVREAGGWGVVGGLRAKNNGRADVALAPLTRIVESDSDQWFHG